MISPTLKNYKTFKAKQMRIGGEEKKNAVLLILMSNLQVTNIII